MVITVYNEKIKKEFLEEEAKKTKDTLKTFKSLFETTEEIEIKYKEDLYLIPIETVAKELLQEGKIGVFSTLKTYMSRIKRYSQWALEKGYIPADYRGLIAEKHNFRKIFNEYAVTAIIKSPEELMKTLKESLSLNYKQEYVNYDFLVAGYLILLFSGVKNEDVMDIKISDFSETNEKIVFKYKERFIKVELEFFKTIKHILKYRAFCDTAIQPSGVFMGEAFINNGKSWDKQHLKKIIITIVSNKNIFKNRFRSSEVYVMGHLYRNMSSNKKELVRICYGENYTRTQRERVWQIYDIVHSS